MTGVSGAAVRGRRTCWHLARAAAQQRRDLIVDPRAQLINERDIGIEGGLKLRQGLGQLRRKDIKRRGDGE